MIIRSTNIAKALRMGRSQRGYLLDPYRYAAPGFSTWSSVDKATNITLSGGDLIATWSTPDGCVRGTQSRDASENRYFEATLSGSITQGTRVGVGTSSANINGTMHNDSWARCYLRRDNDSYNYGVLGDANYLSSGTIGVRYNATTGEITIKVPGLYYGIAYTIAPGTTLFPMWAPGTSGAGTRGATINTGGSPWVAGKPPGADDWTGAWNSADKNAAVTLSGSDLIAETFGGSIGAVRGTVSWNTGDHYFELTRHVGDAVWSGGLGNSTAALSSWVGSAGGANSWGYYANDGKVYSNGTGVTPAMQSSTIIGVWQNAGVLRISGDGFMGPNITTIASGLFFPMIALVDTAVVTLNVGATAFAYQPSGSGAWG